MNNLKCYAFPILNVVGASSFGFYDDGVNFNTQSRKSPTRRSDPVTSTDIFLLSSAINLDLELDLELDLSLSLGCITDYTFLNESCQLFDVCFSPSPNKIDMVRIINIKSILQIYMAINLITL